MKSNSHFHIIKYRFPILIFCLLLSATNSFAQNQIEGVWKSSDNKYMMKISSLGDEYHGRIVWLQNPAMQDVKNPDEKLSKLPVKGSKILEGLKYNASTGKWNGGKLYIPDHGKYYQCDVSVDGNSLKMNYHSGTDQSSKTWTWVKQ